MLTQSVFALRVLPHLVNVWRTVCLLADRRVVMLCYVFFLQCAARMIEHVVAHVLRPLTDVEPCVHCAECLMSMVFLVDL